MDERDTAVAGRAGHGFLGDLLAGRVRWTAIAALPVRLAPDLAAGGLPEVVAASLAIAQRCVEHGIELVALRGADGRPLVEHEALRRLAASNAADVFAIEAAAIAIALELPAGAALGTRLGEVAAASLAVRGCARVADRAWALLGAAGDTPAVALERALHDAAAIRLAGGADVLAEHRAVRDALLAIHDPARPQPVVRAAPITEPRLSRRNGAHLELIAGEVERLGHYCRELRYLHDDAGMHRHQGALIGVGRIAHELLAMCAALARAATAPPAARARCQALADVYCAGARYRVRAAALELAGDPDPGLAHSVAACLGALPSPTAR